MSGDLAVPHNNPTTITQQKDDAAMAWKRALRVAAAAGALCAAGISTAPPSAAFDAEGDSFLRFTVGADEPESAGETFNYNLDNARFDLRGDGQNNIYLWVEGTDGGWWALYFGAPDGQALEPGLYDPSYRDHTGPIAVGNLTGWKRTCTTYGNFEVLDIAFGTKGYVERLHVTFEQYCDGSSSPTIGEVLIDSAPPPPLVDFTTQINSVTTSRLDRGLRLEGTVACTEVVAVWLQISARQRNEGNQVASAESAVAVDCLPGDNTWEMELDDPDHNFAPGQVDLVVSPGATDPNYNELVIETEEVNHRVRLLDQGRPRG